MRDRRANLLMAGLISIGLALPCRAATIQVTPAGDLLVAAEGAPAGSTIELTPGVYATPTTLHLPGNLNYVGDPGAIVQGAPPPNPAPDNGNDVPAAWEFLETSNVTVAGITFTGSSLEFQHTSGVTVKGCTFKDGFRGVFFIGCPGIAIVQNAFSNLADMGVYGYGPFSGTTVDCNGFMANRQACYLGQNGGGGNNSVSGNRIIGCNRNGIEIQAAGGGWTVRQNWIDNWNGNAAQNNGQEQHIGISFSLAGESGISAIGNIVIMNLPGMPLDTAAIEVAAGPNAPPPAPLAAPAANIALVDHNFIYGWGGGEMVYVTGPWVSQANVIVATHQSPIDGAPAVANPPPPVPATAGTLPDQFFPTPAAAADQGIIWPWGVTPYWMSTALRQTLPDGMATAW